MSLEQNNYFLKKRSFEEVFIMERFIESYFENKLNVIGVSDDVDCEERKKFIMDFIRVMNIDFSNELAYELDKIYCQYLYKCDIKTSDYKYFEKVLPYTYNIMDFFNIVDFLMNNFYSDLKEIMQSSIRYLKCDDRDKYFDEYNYSIIDLCVVSVVDKMELFFKYPKSYDFLCKSEYIQKKFNSYELLILEKSDENLLSYLKRIDFRNDSKDKK